MTQTLRATELVESLLCSCVNLSKSCNPSEPQFPDPCRTLRQQWAWFGLFWSQTGPGRVSCFSCQRLSSAGLAAGSPRVWTCAQ